MTQDQAIRNFVETVQRVLESPAMLRAGECMEDAGLNISLDIAMNIQRVSAEPENQDAAFLRDMRIAPDLKVEEKKVEIPPRPFLKAEPSTWWALKKIARALGMREDRA